MNHQQGYRHKPRKIVESDYYPAHHRALLRVAIIVLLFLATILAGNWLIPQRTATPTVDHPPEFLGVNDDPCPCAVCARAAYDGMVR